MFNLKNSTMAKACAIFKNRTNVVHFVGDCGSSLEVGGTGAQRRGFRQFSGLLGGWCNG